MGAEADRLISCTGLLEFVKRVGEFKAPWLQSRQGVGLFMICNGKFLVVRRFLTGVLNDIDRRDLC